ncbi:MAG: hypothetical protein E6R03_15095 [Hyphomicrobiaceae bacterium]|nr:MAG: hypothetical protein E6R03_15095 [Hyphomicrobiaceae bacterium]
MRNLRRGKTGGITMLRKVVAHFSGGVDSTAAIILSLQNSNDGVRGLFIDYGQPYRLAEATSVAALDAQISERFGNWLGYETMQVSSLCTEQDYIPMRNLVLAAMSINYALRIGAERIVTGSKRPFVDETDEWCFRDTGLEFFGAIEKTVEIGSQRGTIVPRFVHPLHNYRNGKKAAALQLIEAQGIDSALLWSCFSNKQEPCGQCHACEEFQKARTGE